MRDKGIVKYYQALSVGKVCSAYCILPFCFIILKRVWTDVVQIQNRSGTRTVSESIALIAHIRFPFAVTKASGFSWPALLSSRSIIMCVAKLETEGMGNRGCFIFFPFLWSKCLSLVGKVPSTATARKPLLLPVFTHDRRHPRR